MKKPILQVLLLMVVNVSFAQGNAYYDPAQAYVRLLLERDNNTYKLIGNFKVIGTCFLFGEKHPGDLYAKGETAKNIYLSYNTYNQQVEFYSTANPDKPLVKEPAEVDSFILKGGYTAEIASDLHFINTSYLNSSEKGFFQVVYSGPRFNLYKKYKSSLGYVSTNYIQPDLRQFDLDYEYFYSDSAAKGTNKIRMTLSGIKKEFKPVKDISPALDKDLYSLNPEAVLINVFKLLNE